MNRFVVGVRANLQTFVRTPLNVVLALVLPLVVIEGWGQAMAGLPSMPTVEGIPLDLGRLLGAIFGVAIIAGLMGLVQMISAREADRRLVQTGYAPRTLLATRLATLAGVTIVVAGVNFGVLWLTIDVEAPLFVFAFLALAGVVYAFLGALVGAVLPRLFEGSLVVVFLAMMDAFLSGDSPLAADVPDFVQYFPLYHPKELLQSAAFDGTFAAGDLVFVGGYLLVLLVLVTAVFGATMRTAGGVVSVNRTATAFGIGLREHARNYVLVALLVVLPVSFITLAFAVTQDVQMPVRTVVDGETTTVMRGMPEVHGVIMTPITSSFIAGLAGLFLMREARDTDGRLAVVGYRARQVIAARFGVLAVITLVVVGASVGVMLIDFQPEQLWWFVAAMLILSVTYGLIGMLVGAVFNRLAGLWIMLILPMIDIGLFQDPLFVQSEPEWWMKLFPGYHPVRVMVDTGLTTDLDTAASLGWGFGYLLVVGLLAVWVYYRGTRTT